MNDMQTFTAFPKYCFNFLFSSYCIIIRNASIECTLTFYIFWHSNQWFIFHVKSYPSTFSDLIDLELTRSTVRLTLNVACSCEMWKSEKIPVWTKALAWTHLASSVVTLRPLSLANTMADWNKKDGGTEVRWNLTHWGRDKMADISQTCSNAFSWMRVYDFKYFQGLPFRLFEFEDLHSPVKFRRGHIFQWYWKKWKVSIAMWAMRFWHLIAQRNFS